MLKNIPEILFNNLPDASNASIVFLKVGNCLVCSILRISSLATFNAYSKQVNSVHPLSSQKEVFHKEYPNSLVRDCFSNGPKFGLALKK
jgi:hypothetical protein